MYKIGEMSKRLDVSIDTLRYYEKIGLLPRIFRKNTGLRLYNDHDVARVNFIKRSLCMKFSLDEIKLLLKFREAPQGVSPDLCELACNKLEEIESHLKDLNLLKNELHHLITRCSDEGGCCSILNAMEGKE